MKTKTILFLGLFIAFVSLVKAQTPTITFTTNNGIGTELTVKIRTSSESIKIDWGNGIVTVYSDVALKNGFVIIGNKVGSTIKVYDDAINMFEAMKAGITDIDLSRAKNLRIVNLTKNNLKNINTASNTKLQNLTVAGNQLKTLDVSNHPNLNNLFLGGNQFDACALNEIYKGLPNISKDYEVRNENNPGTSTSNTAIANAKGWRVRVAGDASGCSH